MRVAVLGGTGSFGSALATRLREVGVEVVIGSRDADRAREHASTLGVEGATNADAASSSLGGRLAVRAAISSEHPLACASASIACIAREPSPRAGTLAIRRNASSD